MDAKEPHDPNGWWRNAVVYQVYVRSFADANGDGVGDLEGVRSRLPYLRDLGVDALWFNPWYRSPFADGGYDVADYRAIDPRFGTLREAEVLIQEALSLGIRSIIDVVPNHVSDQHPWFQAALAAGPDSPERSRFWFRDGKGPNGDLLPTQWPSEFAGNTWTRTTDPDGEPGAWYLHMFAPEQPDLNWNHPDVHDEFLDVLRFWFERGVAGVRVDSAALLSKHPDLPELDGPYEPGQHPYKDRDEVHDVYRAWRRVADSHDPARILVGEVWLEDAKRMASYLRPDEMHTAFNFDFMAAPWDADAMRQSITSTLSTHEDVGAPATWVLANHDVTRTVTRYGREETSFSFADRRFGVGADHAVGTRRARAAILLAAALPGSLYIYQGDELGLPEVEDLPNSLRQDPTYHRSEGSVPGRDGCRVPLPWSGSNSPFGFSPGHDTTPWLPQPSDWDALTAETQAHDPGSMLWLYRSTLATRRRLPDLREDSFAWWPANPNGVLTFRRGDTFACVVNFTNETIHLMDGVRVSLTSAACERRELGPDCAAWLDLTDLPASYVGALVTSAPPSRTFEVEEVRSDLIDASLPH